MWRKGNSPHFYPIGEWAELDDVLVCVHDVFESFREADSQYSGRIFYLNVGFRNATTEPFKYRLGQWTLYDVDGYSYGSKMGREFYEPWGIRPIRENRILPYNIVRGWIAIPISANVKPHYLHFQEHYGGNARVADFLVDRTRLPFRPFGDINERVEATTNKTQKNDDSWLHKLFK